MEKKYKRRASLLLLTFFITFIAVQLSFLGNDVLSNHLEKNYNAHTFVDENQFNIPPKPSNLNTIVYLLGINQSHTVRGQNLTLSGYTQKYVDPAFTNWSNIPVFPIIDGHKYDGTETGYANLTVRSSYNVINGHGQFNISFQVPENYVYSTDMIITVNVTQIIEENILVNHLTVMTSPISHDITTEASLIVTTNIVNPVLTNDSFSLSFLLRDSTGGAIQIAENLTVFRNLDPMNVNGTITPNTNILGQGTILYYQENGLMALGVNFSGKGYKMGWGAPYYEIRPVINSTTILRPEWINITFTITNMVDETETQYVYANKSMRVNGQVRANGLTGGSGLTVANRQIRLFINNNTLTNLSTDGEGSFSYTFNLQVVGFHQTDTTFALRVLLLGYDTSFPTGNVTFIDQVLVQVINQPPPAPIIVEPTPPAPSEASNQQWVAILIPIAIVAGLIVGIVIFQRKRMDMINKRDAMLRAVDKSGKMWIIMNLYNAQRRREAIAYTYKIYTDLFNEKYSVKRENAQTLREFAILTVTKYGQDPLHIYPYVSIIENVIYGAMDVDYSAFEKALTLFGRVFEDLTGTLLNLSLMRNPDTEFDEITIEVVGSTPALQAKTGGSTPP